jgi:5'-deoxynucleotidase YfbR-like HD superfamily hydrolase
MNFVKSLIHTQFNALRQIIRFATRPRLHNESVAEHSFYVVLYVLEIARWLKDHSDLYIDIHELVLMAIYHDLDEAITGDLMRAFKQTDSVTEQLEYCITTAIKAHLDPESFKHWADQKDGSLEAEILYISDWLVGIRYMFLEAEMGNIAMLRGGCQLIEEDIPKLSVKCPKLTGHGLIRMVQETVVDELNNYIGGRHA